MHQIEMVSLDSLVQESHFYRNFNQIWSFINTEMKLRKFEKKTPIRVMDFLDCLNAYYFSLWKT